MWRRSVYDCFSDSPQNGCHHGHSSPQTRIKIQSLDLNLSSPRCALRALGLLLYSRIPQWEGGRLFDMSAGFFMETAVTLERKVEK